MISHVFVMQVAYEMIHRHGMATIITQWQGDLDPPLVPKEDIKSTTVRD